MLASSSRQAITRIQSKICTTTSQTVLNFHRSIPRRIHRRHASAAYSQRETQGATSSSSKLRSEPWSFTPDFTFQSRHHLSALAQYQLKMSEYAEDGRVIDCFHVCKEMKEQGIAPSLFIYNDLLKAVAKDGLHMEAEGIIDDMFSIGIRPDRQSYHHLIYSKRALEADHMWNVLERMQELDIHPNPQTYSYILERSLHEDNLEMAIQYVGEMNDRGISLELHVAQAVIIMATKLGYPRLALEMAISFEKGSVRRLDNEVWVNCLISSAENLYVDGVQLTWTKVVNELGITPDEGLCMDVLHTVARHGLPDLGTDVMRVMKLIGASWQEHHLAAVIEAFCKAGKLKEAFETLHVMRENNIIPATETAYAIFDIIKHDVDAMDGSWAILDQLRSEGKVIDVTAVNVVIRAAVFLGDIQRAIGAYKTVPDYGVKPNIDTFNFLLSACIAVGHRDLGDHLVRDMKEAAIKPDVRTYERLIILCLTQPTYEDAFFYLEEMKSHKFVPTIGIYDAIVKKCFSVGDSRYTLALEEMKQCGYSVSTDLADFLNHSGAYEVPGNENKPISNGEDVTERPSP